MHLWVTWSVAELTAWKTLERSTTTTTTIASSTAVLIISNKLICFNKQIDLSPTFIRNYPMNDSSLKKKKRQLDRWRKIGSMPKGLKEWIGCMPMKDWRMSSNKEGWKRSERGFIWLTKGSARCRWRRSERGFIPMETKQSVRHCRIVRTKKKKHSATTSAK